MLLKIVIEYCQIITDIPSVAPEVLNRLVELLKVTHFTVCYWCCTIFIVGSQTCLSTIRHVHLHKSKILK